MGLPLQNLYRMIISHVYCFFMLNIPRMDTYGYVDGKSREYRVFAIFI